MLFSCYGSCVVLLAYSKSLTLAHINDGKSFEMNDLSLIFFPMMQEARIGTGMCKIITFTEHVTTLHKRTSCIKGFNMGQCWIMNHVTENSTLSIGMWVLFEVQPPLPFHLVSVELLRMLTWRRCHQPLLGRKDSLLVKHHATNASVRHLIFT